MMKRMRKIAIKVDYIYITRSPQVESFTMLENSNIDDCVTSAPDTTCRKMTKVERKP